VTVRRPEIRFETVSQASFDDAAARQYPYVFLPAYLNFLEQQSARRVLYAVSSDGEVRLPLLVKSSRVFRLGQILSPPLRSGAQLSPEEERSFLEALIESLRRHRVCHRLLQPATNCVFQCAPAGARACRFGTYRLALANRIEEDILQAMHTTHRYQIRAAIRKGAEVRFGRAQLRPLFDLHAATMRRSNLGHDRLEYLEGLFSVLSDLDSVCCAVVYSGETPMGGVLVPFTRHGGYYSYGGSAAAVEPPGAVKLLHWEVARHLRERGVAFYDFVGARLSNVEGTKLEGIQRFKARFGSTLLEGCLWKSDITPTVAGMFDLAVAVQRAIRGNGRTQFADIIEQECRKTSTPGSLPRARTPEPQSIPSS
jgi:Acetyltransferase (GNAT) domain